MRAALNWFDTGYRSTKKRKPQQRSKAAAKARPAAPRAVPRKERVAQPSAKAKASRPGPPRVAVPSAAFDRMRDQAGWPDYERRWVTFNGKKWWPFLVMEHAVTLLQGTKDLQDADVVVEFVREGGPIKP